MRASNAWTLRWSGCWKLQQTPEAVIGWRGKYFLECDWLKYWNNVIGRCQKNSKTLVESSCDQWEGLRTQWKEKYKNKACLERRFIPGARRRRSKESLDLKLKSLELEWYLFKILEAVLWKSSETKQKEVTLKGLLPGIRVGWNGGEIRLKSVSSFWKNVERERALIKTTVKRKVQESVLSFWKHVERERAGACGEAEGGC